MSIWEPCPPNADKEEQRREAYELIRRAEEAHERALKEPTYILGGYDEYGDQIPVENLKPWDKLDSALTAIANNGLALSILGSVHRTDPDIR